MDQFSGAAMNYEGFGGFEVNDMALASFMEPVGVPEMNSWMPNQVQVNDVAYFPPQADNNYFPNNNYSEPQTGEMSKLMGQVEFWKRETRFWQFEGNGYTTELNTWKYQAESWKREAEKCKADLAKWKVEATNWNSEAVKWKAEATNWNAEAMKWKAEATKWNAEAMKFKDDANRWEMDFIKLCEQNRTFQELFMECNEAKEADLLKFQETFDQLTLELDEKNKIIELQKLDLRSEKKGCYLLQLKLQTQIEVVDQLKDRHKTYVTSLKNQALAKETELRDKMKNQTREYENFTAGANGRVSELEGKVRNLENDLEYKESLISGFNKYYGQIYELKRQADVELRDLKDFVTSLTFDLQTNLSKFINRYGLNVTPEVDSKCDWKTKEAKCLASHLRMLVRLTEDTYKEWEELGMLKPKQAREADKQIAAENAVGAGGVKPPLQKGMDAEKPGQPGCSSNSSVAEKRSSSKKWKF